MPIRISSSRLSWLWHAAGLVDEQTRARILGEYHAISSLNLP